MRSYQAARSLFSFMGFCSWAVIVIGAILAFSGGTIVGTGLAREASGMAALLGAAPGFILAMLGFYGLALVQMGRAGVDSAEYGQQALDVARKQLEVSQQALDQGKAIAASYAAMKPAKKRTSETQAVKDEADSGPSYASRTNGADVTASASKPKPAKQPAQQIAEIAASTTMTAESELPAAQKALSSPEPVVVVADLMPPEPEPIAVEKKEQTIPHKATMPSETQSDQSVPVGSSPDATRDQVTPGAQGRPVLSPKELEIVYKDGTFNVGGEAFANKRAALLHREKLMATPIESSTG